ncbi:hypothetical protein G6F46_014016 [Rhizopus delemar]|nr:hypothetical protein G6F46_014016 [Rhizopus delemar]
MRVSQAANTSCSCSRTSTPAARAAAWLRPERDQPSTAWPARARWLAMGVPMTPRPMNPKGMAGSRAGQDAHHAADRRCVAQPAARRISAYPTSSRTHSGSVTNEAIIQRSALRDATVAGPIWPAASSDDVRLA